MLEAIGRTCIDDDGSHVRRRIASKRIEIDEARVRPGGIGPQFPALDRTDRRRDFQTLAGDLAGKVGGCGVDWDEDVALDDIVERYGPFCPAVPELLLCASFVEPRAGQLQFARRN